MRLQERVQCWLQMELLIYLKAIAAHQVMQLNFHLQLEQVMLQLKMPISSVGALSVSGVGRADTDVGVGVYIMNL